MTGCMECGAEYTEDLSTCPACGSGGEPVRCARCGERFEGLDACPACGEAWARLACDRHPERGAEGRCVVCGRALCGECRSKRGRAHLCTEHEDVTVIQGWAQIYSTTSEFEAQLLRENLISEGIEARIFSQKDNMLSVDLGELSIVRILVPAWDYERAEGLIEAHMDPEGEVSFACPSCGEAYDPGTEKCASCGALLGSGRPD